MPPDKLLLNYLIFLLSTCQSSGTSFEEGRGKVSISPKEGEDVYFFALDNDNGREALRMVEETICDGLIFFGHDGRKSRRYLEKICLVELKGGNIEHGIKQILNTYTHFWKLLLCSPCQHKAKEIIKMAYIYQRGSAPKQTKHLYDLRKQLQDIFGNKYKITRESDLGPFLRK